MNTKLLRSYINEYKRQFSSIHKNEIYKWQAIKQFQDNWDISAYDFYSMLQNSLLLSENLLDSGNYFPKRMLLKNTEKSQNEIRTLFKNLFNEEDDLYKRIAQFQKNFKKISDTNFPNLENDFQDHRAIMVYLNLRNPEFYYLYKFTMFKDSAAKLQFDYKPIVGRQDNIGQYITMCNLINYEIKRDQELLKLHKARISNDCYYDINLHILTQDLIYAVARYLDVSTQSVAVENKKYIPASIIKTSKLQTKDESIDLEPKFINHLQNMIDAKKIGDLGEQWVFNYETNRLENAGKKKLAKDVEHISAKRGDGAGYDILSFEEDGSKRFIEVKTTKGNFYQTFYVTQNELKKSQIEKNNYYLYRVYNYDEKTDEAELMILNGDLSSLCVNPLSYKVILKKSVDKSQN